MNLFKGEKKRMPKIILFVLFIFVMFQPPMETRAQTPDLTGEWNDAEGKTVTFKQFGDPEGGAQALLIIQNANCQDPLSDKCVVFEGLVSGTHIDLEHPFTERTVGLFYPGVNQEIQKQLVGMSASMVGSVNANGETISAELTIPQFTLNQETSALTESLPKRISISFSAKPKILIRDSRENSSVNNVSLPGVTSDQPFFIDVRLPRADGQKAGAFISVDIKHTWWNSTSLRLGNQNSPVSGAMVYTTPDPVTIDRGGVGAGEISILAEAWVPRTLRALAPGNMSHLKVPNGGTVTASYKEGSTNISTEFNVYTSKTRLALGLCQTSLDSVYALYGRTLSEFSAQITPNGNKALRSKMKAIENARRIMAFEPKEDDRHQFFFADTTRLEVCKRYFNLVLTDPATWDLLDPRFSVEGTYPRKGLDGRFPNVSYETFTEGLLVNLAIKTGEEMWKDIALKSLANLTIDLYQVYISVTLSGPLWIVVTGTNPVTGQRVSLEDRVWAGVQFGSGVILGVLGPKVIGDRINNYTNGGPRPDFRPFPRLSPRPNPRPSSGPVPDGIFNESTRTLYEVYEVKTVNGVPHTFHARAWIQREGVSRDLTMEFYLVAKGSPVRSTMRGYEHFQEAVKKFEGQFDGIHGRWLYGDNLEAFNNGVSVFTRSGTPISEGALKRLALDATSTGRWARDAGYTDVKFLKLEQEGSIPAGLYSGIEVRFTRPR